MKLYSIPMTKPTFDEWLWRVCVEYTSIFCRFEGWNGHKFYWQTPRQMYYRITDIVDGEPSEEYKRYLKAYESGEGIQVEIPKKR